ncbi:expressed unknown protein [Seminavis robusta]|uniref:Uncharacterized protein n=1 Tax=Seminavis robusta TaxID=568900 RepID=A0A9N8EWJ5_9STRA|nr:expressed unknown protein [Seminavis robusta]|eukprot:Sro1971_g308591.1  (217) ;mRNA; r:13129-14195
MWDDNSYKSWGSFFDDDGYYYNHLEQFGLDGDDVYGGVYGNVTGAEEGDDGNSRAGSSTASTRYIYGKERPCDRCGCANHIDEYGDQICSCDTCKHLFNWKQAREQVCLYLRSSLYCQALQAQREDDDNIGFDLMNVGCDICNSPIQAEQAGYLRCECRNWGQIFDWIDAKQAFQARGMPQTTKGISDVVPQEMSIPPILPTGTSFAQPEGSHTCG